MVQMKTDQQRTLGSLNSAVRRKVYQLNQMKTETAYKEYLLTRHLGILAPKVSELARKHDTPYSTLNHRIAGRGTKAEAADEWRLIPVASEAALVDYLRETAERGFPDTARRAERRAIQILRDIKDDPTAEPGTNWVWKMLRRNWESLSMYWSTSLTTVRGGALNEQTVNHWFELLARLIKEYNLSDSPELIFAMDETSCFLDKCTRKTRHIAARGIQQQIALWNENRETATLIPIISADGTVYPPTVIFSGKQIRGKDDLPNPLNAS